MTSMIQCAAKGQRKAMELLYEANKKKVYYVSLCLLGDTKQAAEATSWVFKNIWSDMNTHGIVTEEEFSNLAISNVVDYCKRNISKQNSNAFKIPIHHNFKIIGSSPISENSEDVEKAVLSQLPELQKFIFVLHTIGEYLPEQIASVFKFNVKEIEYALKAEKSNIEQMLGILKEKGQYSYESIVESVQGGEKNVKVPDKINEQTLAVIDGIAAPIEKRKRKTITLVSVITAVLCLCIIGGIFFAVHLSGKNSSSGEDGTSVTDKATENVTDTSYNPTALDADLTYYADIDIKDYGMITVQLDQESAPISAANFVSLAESGFYDGLTFHRIMEGFMMQGGDPNGNGSGGSENTIVGEFAANGYDNNLSHTRGAISMARSNAFDSASSQFFIVHKDSTSLDGQYAVFGYVTEGLEVVDAVCETAEPTDSNGTIPADAQPVITSITIRTE